MLVAEAQPEILMYLLLVLASANGIGEFQKVSSTDIGNTTGFMTAPAPRHTPPASVFEPVVFEGRKIQPVVFIRLRCQPHISA